MTESEIQVYVELTTKAQDNDLTEEEFKLYVKLTTTFVLQVSEQVNQLQQNWEDTERVNSVLCNFIEDKELVDDLRDFVEEIAEQAAEEQIIN